MRAFILAGLCWFLVPARLLAAPAEEIARLEGLYAKRDDPQAAPELEEAMAEAVKAHPEDYEVLWRACRYHVWMAENVGTEAQKKVEAKLGWDHGDRARKAAPDRAEGHYFAGASVGLWSEANGILRSIAEGADGKFNERVDRAIQLDPKVDRSGPFSLKGRYFFTVPWPMRDLKKSTQLLEKAAAQSPESLRIKYYLAETLLKVGKKQEAKQLIDQVLGGDEAYDPAEARLVKRLAAPAAKAIAQALK